LQNAFIASSASKNASTEKSFTDFNVRNGGPSCNKSSSFS